MINHLVQPIKNLAILIGIFLTISLFNPILVLASEQLPSDDVPLSEIIGNLESQDYFLIEVEFENEVWDVEAYRDGQQYELTIDPRSGNILPPQLHQYPKALSKIVANVEAKGYLPIEVEYETNIWEIEACQNGQQYQLKIDPESGNIISIKEE
ncbi:PepSY domain-containing protein [Euhalothece natronophila Z-M001]|uniref:PepSY domain-containing protein n=1 Tax=Euhalothece natronophila Z-M001 TaxID=522448 RepID=A0A5B8NPE5_9CHRO|nr:PepSY domain-containing protein [Euhalothece natronophila]QDZ40826.1 PepSY domain-containing protein [Euhalothece natronophila Z-M001]